MKFIFLLFFANFLFIFKGHSVINSYDDIPYNFESYSPIKKLDSRTQEPLYGIENLVDTNNADFHSVESISSRITENIKYSNELLSNSVLTESLDGDGARTRNVSLSDDLMRTSSGSYDFEAEAEDDKTSVITLGDISEGDLHSPYILRILGAAKIDSCPEKEAFVIETDAQKKESGSEVDSSQYACKSIVTEVLSDQGDENEAAEVDHTGLYSDAALYHVLPSAPMFQEVEYSSDDIQLFIDQQRNSFIDYLESKRIDSFFQRVSKGSREKPYFLEFEQHIKLLDAEKEIFTQLFNELSIIKNIHYLNISKSLIILNKINKSVKTAFLMSYITVKSCLLRHEIQVDARDISEALHDVAKEVQSYFFDGNGYPQYIFSEHQKDLKTELNKLKSLSLNNKLLFLAVNYLIRNLNVKIDEKIQSLMNEILNPDINTTLLDAFTLKKVKSKGFWC